MMSMERETVRKLKHLEKDFREQLFLGESPLFSVIAESIPERVAVALQKAGYPSVIRRTLVEFWLLGKYSTDPSLTNSAIRHEITTAIQNTNIEIGGNGILHRYIPDGPRNKRGVVSGRFRLVPVKRQRIFRYTPCEKTGGTVDIDIICNPPRDKKCPCFAGFNGKGALICAYREGFK